MITVTGGRGRIVERMKSPNHPVRRDNRSSLRKWHQPAVDSPGPIRRVLLVAFTIASFVTATVTVTGSSANAKPFIPGAVPIDRVIQNVTDFATNHPDDNFAHYLVGRAHYAALFDLQEISVKLAEGDQPAAFPNALGLLYPATSTTVSKLDTNRISHVETAVAELRTAVRLVRAVNPRTDLEMGREGLYLLTLASITEQVAPFADQLSSPPIIVKKQPKTWQKSASDAYLLSYQLTIAKDLQVAKQPLFGLPTLISYEAGNAYIRLNPKAPKVAAIKKAIKQLDKKPQGPITPFILSLNESQAHLSIDSLLDANVTTSFDLDGTGRAQRYPWVRRDTAILVWDPPHRGLITSGRQLFGTATWWMLWENAYQALDSLDDNRDGWLRGPELPGLGIWVDENQNGISETGEVIAIEDTSVVGIRRVLLVRMGVL
jgi:hypothetical protein